MAQALALAERGRGRTTPNPMVGAVLVDEEGVVVGRGAHEVAGGPHAEVHALADAAERARGATLYCTLEPCCHTGRTGPCAPLLVQHGIARAVVAVADPNPRVAGKGIAHLREHGVEVSVGVLHDEAAALNAPFFSGMRRGRPFVTMKVALSRDGKVAARPGRRTPLTGPAANRFIHRERAEMDAIAVGSGTMVVDDPLLTPRGAYRARPLTRVVFDRSLRTPPSASMLATLDAGPIMVMTVPPEGPGARQRAEALQRAGALVEPVHVAGTGSGFLGQALARLATLGVSSLTVEGGPTLHRALWDEGLIDRVQIFRSAVAIGPDGLPWVDAEAVRLDALHGLRTVDFGDDSMTEGYVHRPR
jgi:diaminohydroxyphosphoribosylaminopyrimidine deaminase / 5-amino-6-(5-phosphoribosylamino)uracil reductase